MKLLAVLSLLFTSQSVFAWGATGHRVVGEVAQKYLKKSVKRKLDKILDGDSLARVSNWPDKIKSDPDTYGHTYNWHYTDWADHNHDYDPVNNNGFLITAIDNNLKTLKDKNSTKKDKRFAIAFLAHLIGDLHQPLHVGNGKDRGGNSCRVLFHDVETNLHALWDSDMINFTKLSFTELTRFIDNVSKKEVKKIAKGNPLDWAKESVIIRNTVYPGEVVSANTDAPKTTSEVPNYCNRELTLSTEELPDLSYKYSYRFLPIVERRMLEGGIRLAMVLNEAL